MVYNHIRALKGLLSGLWLVISNMNLQASERSSGPGVSKPAAGDGHRRGDG